MVLEPLLIIGVAGSAAVAAWIGQRRMQRRAEAAWRQTARDLRLRYTPPSSSFVRRHSMALEGRLDGSDVRADIYWVSSGKSAQAYTRVVAATPGAPRCFDFQLRKHGMLQDLGKLLGVRTVETGDADFDARFVLKAADATLARTTLGPVLRQRLAQFPNVTFHFTQGALTATVVGEVTEAAWLRELLRVVAAFSAAPAIRLAQWTDLARKLGGALGSGRGFVDRGELPAISLEAHGVELSLADDPAGDRLVLLPGGGGDPAATIPHPAAAPLADDAVVAEVQQAVETVTAASLGLRPYRG